jgi:hypothetical protein
MENKTTPDAGTGSPNPAASAPEVKKDAVTPDYEVMLKDKDSKISRLSVDRDNYRAGMLKYKKLAEDNPDDKSLDEERVKQMIKEEMVTSELFKEQTEKEALVMTLAKENKELKVAMANKSQISNIPGGSSQPQDDLTVEQLTPEQKVYFDNISKEIGVKIDPKKFLENWNRINKK